MCRERYLVADEMYFFAKGWTHGEVGETVKVDLPLNHPDADFIEMQILGCTGQDGRVNLHMTSKESDERYFLAGVVPPATVLGAQPPVGRLLRGVSALWLTVNTKEPREDAHAIVALRLYGTRRGGCRG